MNDLKEEASTTLLHNHHMDLFMPVLLQPQSFRLH